MKSRYKGLQVSPSISPTDGGPTTFALSLNQSISAYFTNTFITTDANGVKSSRIFKPENLDSNVLLFRRSFPKRFGFSLGMYKWLKANISKYDFVHVHYFYLAHNILVWHFCRKYSIPYLLQPHGSLERYQRRHHRWRKFIFCKLIGDRILQGASALVCASKQEQLSIEEILDSSRYFVHALPLSSEFLSNVSSFDSQERYLTVQFVGRFAEKKRLDLLVQAWVQVSRTIPKAKLRISGIDSFWTADELQEMVNQYQVDKSVVITGPIFGVLKAEVFSTADVVVLPSENENFAIVIPEALVAGCKVVVSNQIGSLEYITDKNHIFTLPTLTPTALAETIVEALNYKLTPEERLIMVSNPARDIFSISNYSRDYASFIFEMLKS